MIKVVEVFQADRNTKRELPLFLSKIRAGFPSPADDYQDKKLDLNEYLIKHQAATFFVRVRGDSMIKAGIHSGDILVVDRSIEPKEKKVVVAVVNGEFTVKRVCKIKNKLFLIPESDDYTPIETSCSIITTMPNKLMAGIHDRMPVILDKEKERQWLTEKDLDKAIGLLKAYSAIRMTAYPISIAVNNPRNNSADIIKPLEL